MRILFVIHTWHPEGRGGSERHARELALALQAGGHQVGVFTRTGRPEMERYEVLTEWQGPIGVTRINNLFWESPSFEWIYKNRKVHEAFVKEVEEFKPDLVHIHHLVGLSTTIVEALKQRDIPVVMTLHDFWTICPRGQRMRSDLELCWEVDRNKCFTCLSGMWFHLFRDRDAERTVVDVRGDLSPQILAEYDRHMVYVLNLCDRLITPSEFHRERMLDFPLDQERIVALQHGLDLEPFESEPRTPRRPRVIGYIGSVIPIKGVHVLVEAFKLLNRSDLLLAIHGEIRPFHEDDTYQDRLNDMARGMDNVVFSGAYDPEDVGLLLADIDILVVPSLWWESFSLTIREGLLAGVPVVAPDLGAMREALDGERDGVLYRPGDAKDLARKLERLLEDDEYRARYMNRGEGVKHLDTYVDEIEEIYSDTVKESNLRSASVTVAPSSFPEERMPVPASERTMLPMAMPWNELAVAVRHQGPLGLSFKTRMPTDEEPALGLDITLHEGDVAKGEVGVVVDMRALQGRLGTSSEAGGHDLERQEVEQDGAAGGRRKIRHDLTATAAGDGKGRAHSHPRVRCIQVEYQHELRHLKLSSPRRNMERLPLGDQEREG